MYKLIKKIRKENGLSQRDMGIKLKAGEGQDKGQSFISQMEKGERKGGKKVPLRVAYILPRLFKLSDEDLKKINDYLERKS